MENSLEFSEKRQSLFKNRSFVLLLCGQIVSNLGSSIHSVAVAWFIMNMVGESRSGTYMAIFGACVLIPYIIFGPISGVFVDRNNRKNIIVGTDIIRGTLIVSLGFFVYFDFFPITMLFIITFLSAFFGSFFNPAVDASIPNIVEERDLTQANSLNGISRQLTLIVGGAISGFLYYQIGVVGIFLVNGISFILSGISEMFIKLPYKKREDITKISFFSDFKDGIKFVRSQKTIMILMAFSLVLNFIFSPIFQIVFPKTLKFTLNMGPQEYGIIQSLFPVGALVGMVLISKLIKIIGSYRLVTFSLIAQTLMMIGFGIPIIPSVLGNLKLEHVFILYCILSLLMMLFNSLINVPVFTAFQKLVPDEFRGRFFGLLNTLSQGIVPIGLGVIGIISDSVIPAILFILSGVVCLIISVWIMFIPELKKLI